jgi:hypothetical protein
VAVDNNPMHRAISRCGYTRQDNVCGLFISHSQIKHSQIDKAISETAHIMPIRTFTYSGVWLEGDISKEAVLAAKNTQTAENLMLTGVIHPLNNTAACDLLIESGFINIGHYQWWQINV